MGRVRHAKQIMTAAAISLICIAGAVGVYI